MNNDQFEARMRKGECFHSLRAPEGSFVVVRVDGRSFSTLTERLAQKPFDEKFHGHMVETTRSLLSGFNPIYAYTESDEISLLLPRETGLFDREVEKLVSLTAARAAATMSLFLGEIVEFDSRLWVGETIDDVVDYFRWRQSDSIRCSLTAWSYWTLRHEGKSPTEATSLLDRAFAADKRALLLERGIQFEDLPGWQRNGTGMHWEAYTKETQNRKTGEDVQVLRRRIVINEDLVLREAYGVFLKDLIIEAESDRSTRDTTQVIPLVASLG